MKSIVFRKVEFNSNESDCCHEPRVTSSWFMYGGHHRYWYDNDLNVVMAKKNKDITILKVIVMSPPNTTLIRYFTDEHGGNINWCVSLKQWLRHHSWNAKLQWLDSRKLSSIMLCYAKFVIWLTGLSYRIWLMGSYYLANLGCPPFRTESKYNTSGSVLLVLLSIIYISES